MFLLEYVFLEILFHNHNRKHNLPLFWLVILVEFFYCCKIIFLKDSNLGKNFVKIFFGNFCTEKYFPRRYLINLGKISIKMFDRNVFTRISFSLEILRQNHNPKHNFPLFWLVILFEFFLFCCKIISSKIVTLQKISSKFFFWKFFCWNMFLFRNTNPKS